MARALLLVLLIGVSEAAARSFRVQMVPNGAEFSCFLCHTRPSYGGPMTSFGEAVELLVDPGSSASFWGPGLASLDSDGDGYTNGQELGDPDGDGKADPQFEPSHPGDPESRPSGLVPHAGQAGLKRLLLSRSLLGELSEESARIDTAPVGAGVFAILARQTRSGLPPHLAVALLPDASPGEPEIRAAFRDDSDIPWTGALLPSSLEARPGRLAGDPRPGASLFAAGAAAALHTRQAFGSGERWRTGLERGPGSLSDVVQLQSLDPPLARSLALDALNGRLAQGSLPASEDASFGSDLAFLENGSLVVAQEDRSGLRAQEAILIAAILAPDGSVARESWVVAREGGRPEVAAFRGGFAIRQASRLHLLDLQGDRLADPLDLRLPFPLDGERHMASHLHQPRIFLAGHESDGALGLAALEMPQAALKPAHRQAAPAMGRFGGLDLAADALGRVAVVRQWNDQVLAQVVEYLPDAERWNPLTPSFLAFDGAQAQDPSVSLSASRLLIAGQEGSQAVVSLIVHPDAMPDPTPPAIAPVVVSVEWAGDQLLVSWTGGAGPFERQWKESLDSPQWRNLGLSTERSFRFEPDGSMGLYRIVDRGAAP